MACDHKHIASINCILHCLDCGVQLPAEFNQPHDKPKKNAKKGAKAK